MLLKFLSDKNVIILVVLSGTSITCGIGETESGESGVFRCGSHIKAPCEVPALGEATATSSHKAKTSFLLWRAEAAFAVKELQEDLKF